MIEALHVTRRYAGVTAVDDLSFKAAAGEIVGLLGPNGAGKTTTARMLAGVLQPTGGRVTVGGLDVHRDGVEARRHLGFLPEDAPAYRELRVREHLDWLGALYGLSARRRLQRIEWSMSVCGLEQESDRLIGTLSRGFRQRTGLAAALLHDPEVLILDEPTAGLDPNQARAVREVIRGLRGSRTILLSTHTLIEAEALCDRVLILCKGRVAAMGAPADLRRGEHGGAGVSAELRGPPEAIRAKCEALMFVVAVETETAGEWVRVRLQCRPGTDARIDLFRLAAREDWEMRALRAEDRSLEDVFARVTGEVGHG